MKRIVALAFGLAALVSSSGLGVAGAAAGAQAYYCAQFTNPTVNQAWQTVCYAPCGKYACG